MASQDSSRRPTIGRVAVAATTVFVLAVDVALILMLMTGVWLAPKSRTEIGAVWAATAFLMMLLVLGLVIGRGIVLSSLRGTVAPWQPLIASAARAAVLSLALPTPWLEWEGRDSAFFLSFYLIPTSATFFFLSMVTLIRRRAR